MDTGLKRSHLYSACLLNVTYRNVLNDDVKRGHATGFVAQYPTRDSWGLVTNRHVGEMAWSDPAKYDCFVLESLTAEIWITADRLMKYELASVHPVCPDDDTVDVCVFPMSLHEAFDGEIILFDLPVDDSCMSAVEQAEHHRKFEEVFASATEPRHIQPRHFLTWDYLEGSQDHWSALDVGEMAFFPGFPEWYDKSQRRPVMRSGVIMSDPQRDVRVYEGGPKRGDGNHQMLFEAFSTDGNSGSPVFVVQRIPWLGQKEAGQYHPLIFAGINCGHFDDAAKKHVGVSRMHKASAVLDVLQKASSLQTATNPASSRRIAGTPDV
jgi:hypothetical protein